MMKILNKPLLIITLVFCSLISGALHAATIEVRSGIDRPFNCSFRDAVESFESNGNGLADGCRNISSNSFGNNDTIVFANSIANNRIELQDFIEISRFVFGSGLTIDGSTRNGNIIIDGNNQTDILIEVDGVDLVLENITLTGTATGSSSVGGAVSIFGSEDVTVTFNNCLITDNENTGVSARNVDVVINNCTISNNRRGQPGQGSGAQRGGGVFFMTRSTNTDDELIINNSLLTNNTSYISGGSVYVEDSNATINNTVISNNMAGSGTAGGSGGGIHFNVRTPESEGVNLTINNSQIFDNTADDGGGVAIDGNVVANIVDSQITSNTAIRNGGGVRVSGGNSFGEVNASVVFSNTDIVSNNAASSGSLGGGGIYSRSTVITLNNSRVTDNTVDDNRANGAGINAGSSAKFLINESTISGNVGGQQDSAFAGRGGGIYAFRFDELNISNTTISNNSNSNGGGVYIVTNNSQTVTISDNTISGNSVGLDGGAINVRAQDNASLSMVNNTLSDNTPDLDGGAMSLRFEDSTNLSMVNNTLSGNTATADGGAINAWFQDNASLSMINNTLSGNSAATDGGAMSLSFEDNTDLSMVNNTLSGNSASQNGGAIELDTRDSSNIILRSNTIFDNAAQSGTTGGLYIRDNSSLNSISVENTIIANSQGGDCVVLNSSNFIIDSASIIEDGTCGANRSGDPELLPLADNGGSTFTHAFPETSIAIKTGNVCEPNDQRGITRESPCDVGAYESDFFAPEVPTDFIVIPLDNGKAVVFPN